MKRMHVMVKVKDLDESMRFYSDLFGAGPSVVKPDYAKWMLEDPRLNFSIGTACCGSVPGIEHLGIEAESAAELAELRARITGLGAAGAAVDDEGETTCCYAESEKTWVTDAQGVSWEAFYTHGQAESFAGASATSRASDCCGPECCAGDDLAGAGAAAG